MPNTVGSNPSCRILCATTNDGRPYFNIFVNGWYTGSSAGLAWAGSGGGGASTATTAGGGAATLASTLALYEAPPSVALTAAGAAGAATDGNDGTVAAAAAALAETPAAVPTGPTSPSSASGRFSFVSNSTSTFSRREMSRETADSFSSDSAENWFRNCVELQRGPCTTTQNSKQSTHT